MAITAALVRDGVHTRQWGITATADGDTTITIDHGMAIEVGGAPIAVLTPIQQAPAALSAWAVTNANPTQITLTKGTGAGSGAPGSQVVLTAFAPRASVLG